jgi:hypothetical protein
MYRIASGKFYPLVALLKIPKLFLAFRFYERFEQKQFLKITFAAVWDGLTKNYTKEFIEVLELTKISSDEQEK